MNETIMNIMNQKTVAIDVALEIICGCDRFDKFDLNMVIKQNKFNVEEMKEITRKFVETNWPSDNYNVQYVEDEIANWYD